MAADGRITPSQTVGPFFAYALTPHAYDFEPLIGNNLRTEDAAVPDAMIEIWQADGRGQYPKSPRGNEHFRGFGRCETTDGAYRFETVMPGPVAGPDGRLQAPHINIAIFSRGLLRHLFTRLYFDGEDLNAEDFVLNLVPPGSRHTLIARRRDSPGAIPTFVLDIRLQGENETVFFEA
jgi:protocatechuate 3,4-dioxygenase, alpha subunit